MNALSAVLAVIAATAGASTGPETWFHIIGGNASKEGLAADIAAVADAGISRFSMAAAAAARCGPASLTASRA